MHDDNLAEIWRSAQRRRADDIYSWFTHFFQRQRRLKSSEPRGFNIPNEAGIVYYAGATEIDNAFVAKLNSWGPMFRVIVAL
jgi:hypothetical protein